MAQKLDGCPWRHSKPIIGTCSICRKTVCSDCQGTHDTNNRVVCKFCKDDIEKLKQKLDSGGYLMDEAEQRKKLLDAQKPVSLIDKMLALFIEPRAPVCTELVHLDEKVIGTCISCKKPVCRKCAHDATAQAASIVCNKCYNSIHNVQEEISQEKLQRFIGGIKGFFGKSYRTLKILTIIGIIIIGFSSIILSVFYFMHADSFENFNSNLKTGNYGIAIKNDLPVLFGEIKDRTLYYIENIGDPNSDYDKFKKQNQLENEENDSGNSNSK